MPSELACRLQAGRSVLSGDGGMEIEDFSASNTRTRRDVRPSQARTLRDVYYNRITVVKYQLN